MKSMLLIALISLLVSMPSFAGKAALVKILKGDARSIVDGKETKLKADDWIDGGAVLKTGEKSFVKLVFIDKSQMNVGPGSEIKIEKFHNKDAGVIDLVKGKIRSQVTKDYLQIQGKDRSKLFIKTPNAVMGIRGTDFMITTNGKNTAAILFEGEVVFNRLKDHSITDSAKLDQIVDNGVRMFPGEFSAISADMNAPTVPALLNVHQREKLEKNANFEKNDAVAKAQRSVVPVGLSGNAVASRPNIDSTVKHDETRASSNAEGYVKDGNVKPANGSFIHLDSATVISPGKDSRLDSNSNTFIASDRSGSVNADGTYVPPKGVDIKENGQIMMAPSTARENNSAGRLEIISARGAVQVVPVTPDQATLIDRQISDRGVKLEDIKADTISTGSKGSISTGTSDVPTNTYPTTTYPTTTGGTSGMGVMTTAGSDGGTTTGGVSGGTITGGTIGTTGMMTDAGATGGGTTTTTGGSSGGGMMTTEPTTTGGSSGTSGPTSGGVTSGAAVGAGV